jgi:hypothetical protein
MQEDAIQITKLLRWIRSGHKNWNRLNRHRLKNRAKSKQQRLSRCIFYCPWTIKRENLYHFEVKSPEVGMRKLGSPFVSGFFPIALVPRIPCFDEKSGTFCLPCSLRKVRAATASPPESGPHPSRLTQRGRASSRPHALWAARTAWPHACCASHTRAIVAWLARPC